MYKNIKKRVFFIIKFSIVKKVGSIINIIFLEMDILKMSFFYFMKILFKPHFLENRKKMDSLHNAVKVKIEILVP
jgi:hypothetical protein